MNIILLINSLEMGGAETQVVQLSNNYSRKGHNVSIVTLMDTQDIYPELNVKVTSLQITKSITSFALGIFQLRKIIINEKPDVVHSHMFHSNIMARLCRLLTPIRKLISTAHSTNEGGRVRMMLYRITDNLCDLFTNVSEKAVDEFIRMKATVPQKIICVHNGIDLKKFEFSSKARTRIRSSLGIEDKKLILAVGRLVEAKDYPNLLHSLCRLSRLRSDFHVAIVGDGPLRNELELFVISNELTDLVSFLGKRLDVSDLMSACDIFVSSSSWEGFGIVVVEALAAGKLVVATDSGGVTEVLQDKGIIVSARNPHLLCEGLLSALECDEVYYKDMVFKAKQRALDFDINSIVDKWLALYE